MSSPKRKLKRWPKRGPGLYTYKGSMAHRFGRAALSWKQRHPGAEEWRLAPPIPGTRVGQDLYIAKTRPAENGYREREPGYAIYGSRAKARQGSPIDTLAFYHDVAGVFAAEKNYGDVYKFHRLTSVRESGTTTRGRFGK